MATKKKKSASKSKPAKKAPKGVKKTAKKVTQKAASKKPASAKKVAKKPAKKVEKKTNVEVTKPKTVAGVSQAAAPKTVKKVEPQADDHLYGDFEAGLEDDDTPFNDDDDDFDTDDKDEFGYESKRSGNPFDDDTFDSEE